MSDSEDANTSAGSDERDYDDHVGLWCKLYAVSESKERDFSPILDLANFSKHSET